MINIKQNFKMEGFYSFSVGNSKTNEIRDISHLVAKDSPNMILDSGLNALGTRSICDGCVVGSGSTTVTPTQTSLVTLVGATTNITSTNHSRVSTPPYYILGRRTFRFAQGVASGNLTEVGTYASSSTNLFSRALIVDTQGEPTTLTILADEWLDVTYELRCYQDLSDKSFTIPSLLGVEYAVVARPAYVSSSISAVSVFENIMYHYTTQSYHHNGAIGIITGGPGGTGSGVSTSYSNYVSGSYERSFILSSGLNDSNLAGGIASTTITTSRAIWQFGYTPAIPKDGFKTLVLTVTISWGRYDT